MNRSSLVLAVALWLAFATFALAGPNSVPPPPANSSTPALLAASIPNCDLLLEAGYGTFQDTAGTISATNTVTVGLWKDQSPAGRNVSQGTALNCPRYATNAVNGLPVVRFNGGGGISGTTQYLTTSSDDTVVVSETIVCACSANWATIASGTTAYYSIGGHQGGYSATGGDGFFVQTTVATIDWTAFTFLELGQGTNSGFAPRAWAATNTSKNLNNGSWHVFTFALGDNGRNVSSLRIDGTDVALSSTGAATKNGSGNWNVGSNATTDTGGGRGFLGDMYFHAHFCRYLSYQEIRTVEKYVATRIGINAGA